ncbi:hypothetical protein KA005_27635, partial [bacterium]|nr:hypothetical protein [bacterium]
EKATYVLSKVSKTDFAYDLSGILQDQLNKKVLDAIAALGDDARGNIEACNAAAEHAKLEFATELKSKLPPYIVEAIEHMTALIDDAEPEEEQDDAEPV